MQYGFVKVAAATPEIKPADCMGNAAAIKKLWKEADQSGCDLVVFPELAVTGSTCGDLFLQGSLQNGCISAVHELADYSHSLRSTAVIGAPVVHNGKLFNCAIIMQSGTILGIVPKSVLPASQKRHFQQAETETTRFHEIGQYQMQEAPLFGTKLLFHAKEHPDFVFSAEIGEDLFAPLAPSVFHTAQGATLVAHLCATAEVIGGNEYRKQSALSQSSRLKAAYVSVNIGEGESSTDAVYSGVNIITEDGCTLSESTPFQTGLTTAEVDLERLMIDRRKENIFQLADTDPSYTWIPFSANADFTFSRTIDSMPFIPHNEEERAARCEQILAIQAHALKKRLVHSWSKSAVVGISGGLDSTLALLVSVYAMDLLDRPHTDVVAVTMPCFGTTNRTRSNAEILCQELGVTFRTVDIGNTVKAHFTDIGHDFNDHSVTFENGQARERTQVLMDIANQTGGMVIGTGDLSELALGWATYNGDHMSMYGVNASLPKTLIRYVVRHIANKHPGTVLAKTLLDILDTPISPELLPADDEKISQKTEDLVGPYELHDFFLYHALRWGYSPKKIYFLAKEAFHDEYSNEVILHWLRTFFRRFFIQQFKRSCLPDGPKIGSISPSPRGGWEMPSDAVSSLWLQEIDSLKA